MTDPELAGGPGSAMPRLSPAETMREYVGLKWLSFGVICHSEIANKYIWVNNNVLSEKNC